MNANLSSEELAALVTAKPKRKCRMVSAAIAIAVLTTGFFLWKKQQAGPHEAVPFVTEPLKKGDINLTITVTGKLQPTNDVTVGSELSGIVKEVYVDFNDHVTQGQPLAKLDTTRIDRQLESNRASVNAAQARVAQAEATVKESTVKLRRLEELNRVSGGKIPSRLDLDTAQAVADRAAADFLSAKAAVATAEAQVRILENDLDRTIIRSPIDGVVLTRSIEPGQTVAASFTAPVLFLIAEKLEHMVLKVAIAEADIARVSPGQAATFTVDAWPGRQYTATVNKVAPGSTALDNRSANSGASSSNDSVVTFATELSVSNNDLSLRPGMTATATISIAKSNDVFVVSTAALRFSPSTGAEEKKEKESFMRSLIPGGSSSRRRYQPPGRTNEGSRIWVLRDGKPAALDVKTGLASGSRVEISGKGLSEDLHVITRANTPAS